MELLPTLWATFFVVLLFSIIAAVVLRGRMYKNRVWIARQTGSDPTDVIWVEDRFYAKNINGLWVLKFKNIKDEAPSFDGSVHTKALRKSPPKILRLTRDQWAALDMSRKLQRGLFLYETTEGEYFPLKIGVNIDGQHTLQRIDANTRMFLIKSTQNKNDLTRNRRREFLVLGGIIAGCIVLGVIFVIGIIYIHNESILGIESAKSACYSATQAAVNGTSNSFIGQIQGVVGG